MSRRYSSAHKQTQVLRRRVEKLQEKANPLFAGYSAISEMPQPRTMARNVKTYIEEGYCSSDAVYKVINYGIINGAAIPPVLYTDSTMKKKIDKHPLLNKLETPNNEMDGVFYRESILGWFLIAGSSFFYANRLAKAGPPDELWLLEANKVKPIPDEKRGIIGYEYADFPAEKNPIAPNLIGHMRTWNPRDPFFGLSPVTVAAILVDQQTAIRKWNLALVQNFAKPPGAWVTDTILSPNDRSKLEARVNEKLTGFRNAGKTPVLDGALKWVPSAVSPADMDWLEGVKYNAGAIANIFNMPPQLIGDTSSTTYDNVQEAKAASYTEYIFPMLDKMYSVLRRWLIPMYPDLCDSKGQPVAYLYYDKQTVEVVQTVIQARLTAATQRANQAWMQGSIMLDEAREMQGLPALKNGAGQVFRFGAVLVLSSDLKAYAEQSMSEPAAPPVPVAEPLPPPGALPGQQPPAPQPTNEKPTTQEKPDAHNDPDKQPGKPGSKPTGKQPANDPDNEKSRQISLQGGVLRSTKALNLSTNEEKRAYADAIETARKHHEDEYEKQIANYFDEERKAVVKAIKSSSSSSASVLAGRANGAINDQSDNLKTVLMDLYKDVSVDFGGQVAAQLSGKKGKVSDFIQMFGDAQLRYLLLMAGTKIQQITSTTLAKIRLELTEGVVAGESIPQLAKRIDDLYLQQIIPNRSTTISRTEVVASSNWSTVESAKQSGLTLQKVWLATDDSRTRPAHAEADGQQVDMDQPFEVDGEELQFPGDSSGSEGNVINCRCTTYFVRVTQNATENDTSEDDSDTEDEKYSKREQYRKFMDKVLV